MMSECKNCNHETRQRADNQWQHAKIDKGIKEPQSKITADALYMAKQCMEKDCKCDNSQPKPKPVDTLKQFGGNLFNAAMGVEKT